MAKINKVLLGESLVGDGNEVAHIDLLMGPRGSAAETAFCNALTNNKDGFTTLLAVIAPNLPCKPNTILYNKVTIKDARQAVQMFGPAQYAVAKAVQDSRCRGRDPGFRSRRRLHLRRRVHSLGSCRRREDPGLQLSRREGVDCSRRCRQADCCRSHCPAQLRPSSLRCEDLKRKPSSAGTDAPPMKGGLLQRLGRLLSGRWNG